MALSDRHLGSRRAGAGGFLLVRASALAIAAGAAALVILIADLPHWRFGPWAALFHGLAVRIGFAVWLVAVAVHAYLGFDSILKDYVHHAALRFACLMASAGVLLALVVYGVAAVLA